MEILSLGEKIKRHRKELNMTLKDLAGGRITPGQISLVECGKSNPSMDLLEYLAATLKTSVEYLMESEETQAEKVCDYYENLAESYIINKDFQIAEQFLENTMYYAERYKLEYRKARNMYLRGIILTHKNEEALAQQLFLAANTIFIKQGNQKEVINTYIKLGKITYKLKAYHSACSYFQQAERILTENKFGDYFLLGEIYYLIALVYYKLNDISTSMNYSYLAKEKFIELNDKKKYGKTLILISEEYLKKEDIASAIKYSKMALEVFKNDEDRNYESKIENDLGKLFYEFDNIEESFVHLNIAKEMRKKSSGPEIIETLTSICENYIKLKDVENSKKTLEEILDNISQGDKNSLLKYYMLKYRVDMLSNSIVEAENTLFLALDYAENCTLIKEVAEISILIGKFYIDVGNDKKATLYLDKGVDLFKKLGILNDL